MGGKLSCPSEVLDPVWVPDEAVTHCMNCGMTAAQQQQQNAAAAAAAANNNSSVRGSISTNGGGGNLLTAGSISARNHSISSASNFSTATLSARGAAPNVVGRGNPDQGKFSWNSRRHHCRACGLLLCSSKSCWGVMTPLEQIYGFPGPVPICTVCADIILPKGSMFSLRRGVTVAFTHEPRSTVTTESQIAPLATANVKSRRFTTNHLRLHKWRPFTRRTTLLLSKTKSSRDVLRGMGSSGTTPRGGSRIGSGTRDSDGPANFGGSAGDWTIDLDAVESIQLMNVAEKDGGDFILISTDFEEHRLQAVKMRFEEMAAVHNQAALDAVETASRAVSDVASSLSPDGGDRDNGSDRRSASSAGTRLRTVMLDREGTVELFDALRRAHATCRRRALSVPPEFRAYLDIDTPIEESSPLLLLPPLAAAASAGASAGMIAGNGGASAAALGGGGGTTALTPRSSSLQVPIPAAMRDKVNSRDRIESGGVSTAGGGAGASFPAAGSLALGGVSPQRGASSRGHFPPIAPVAAKKM